MSKKTNNEESKSTGNVFMDFLINKGMYIDSIKITEDNIDDFINLINGDVGFKSYCPKCGDESIFCGKPILYFCNAIQLYPFSNYADGDTKRYKLKQVILNNLSSSENDVSMWNKETADSKRYEWSSLKDNTRIMTFKFDCAMNKEHHLDFIVKIDNNEMIKIGQYPSIADLEIPELKRYEKVAGKQNKDELRRAMGLYSNGVGIGAFIYLRRVIERMIAEAAKEALKDGNIKDDEFKASHVVDKIKKLEGYLPDFLIENANVYGIVSKAVHALNEEECSSYFQVLWNFTMMTLRQWEELRKNKLDERRIATELNEIHAKLKDKGD